MKNLTPFEKITIAISAGSLLVSILSFICGLTTSPIDILRDHGRAIEAPLMEATVNPATMH